MMFDVTVVIPVSGFTDVVVAPTGFVSVGLPLAVADAMTELPPVPDGAGVGVARPI